MKTCCNINLLFIAGLLAALAGCAGTPRPTPAQLFVPPPAVPSAAPQIKEIAAQVQAAATADNAAAATIHTSAAEGKAKTPAPVQPVLGPYWDAILTGADRVQTAAQSLSGLRQRVDELGAQVGGKEAESTGLRAALASANATIQSEHEARQKAQDALQAAKSDQALRLERMLFGVAVVALLGLGASVSIGFLLHDFRFSIAGGAGCLAMALGCFLLGEVIHYRFWILSGLGVVTAGLALYEFLLHRDDILASFKTPAVVAH